MTDNKQQQLGRMIRTLFLFSLGHMYAIYSGFDIGWGGLSSRVDFYWQMN